MVNDQGVLKERCEPGCDADGTQFKGIFVRNLAYLRARIGKESYGEFLVRNADSIWQHNRPPAEDGEEAPSTFGLLWSGPFDMAEPSRQSSALDAMVAAVPGLP